MQEYQSQYPARDVLSPTDYVKSFINTFEHRCVNVEARMAGVGWNSRKLENKLSLPRLTHQQRLQMWDDMVKQANPTGRRHDTAKPVDDPARHSLLLTPYDLLIPPEPDVKGGFNHLIYHGTIRPVYAWIQRPYTTEDKLAVSLALQQQRIGLHVAAEQEKMKQAAGRWVSPKSKHNLNTYASDLLRRSVVPQLRHDR